MATCPPPCADRDRRAERIRQRQSAIEHPPVRNRSSASAGDGRGARRRIPVSWCRTSRLKPRRCSRVGQRGWELHPVVASRPRDHFVEKALAERLYRHRLRRLAGASADRHAGRRRLHDAQLRCVDDLRSHAPRLKVEFLARCDWLGALCEQRRQRDRRGDPSRIQCRAPLALCRRAQHRAVDRRSRRRHADGARQHCSVEPARARGRGASARVALDRQARRGRSRACGPRSVGHARARCRPPSSSPACRGRWRGRGWRSGVAPTIGVPSGVIGRRPLQNSARAMSPPCGNRSVTTCSSVRRRASCSSQVVARELGRAADADAIAQARDRDLVRLVHDRRFGRAGGVGDRHRDRVALDRIDRDADAQRPQQQRRIAAQRDERRRRRSALRRRSTHAVDAASPSRMQAADARCRSGSARRARARQRRQVCVNLKQSPVSSPGRRSPPTNLCATCGERRLVRAAAGAVEQFVGTP